VDDDDDGDVDGVKSTKASIGIEFILKALN
jgi:hypothetical protein